MNPSSHKHITFFSNNFWTLYKFREDAINLFIKNGYKVNNLSKIHLKIIKFLKLSLKNKTKLSKSSISFSSKYNFDKIIKKWNKLILS